MTNNRIIQIDSVDAYNKLYGWETLHPLVTVVNHANLCVWGLLRVSEGRRRDILSVQCLREFKELAAMFTVV